jgi:hypothetical protein
VALVLIYLSFYVLILPIDWWRKRRGHSTYGLTRAGRSWKTLAVAGFVTAALVEWPSAGEQSRRRFSTGRRKSGRAIVALPCADILVRTSGIIPSRERLLAACRARGFGETACDNGLVAVEARVSHFGRPRYK